MFEKSIRFPEWNIFLCSEPSRQNNGKKHLPRVQPRQLISVSLSQLSQILIWIFYLLLENRTKKSRKFARIWFVRDISDKRWFCRVLLRNFLRYCCRFSWSVINKILNSPFLIRLRVVLFVFSREPLHFLFSKQSSWE